MTPCGLPFLDRPLAWSRDGCSQGVECLGAGQGIGYGEFQDQVDAEWIVIRGQLRGHNDKPFGRPTPGRPIGRPGALAALRAYLLVLVTINYQYFFLTLSP
jgi:hypothetical protein